MACPTGQRSRQAQRVARRRGQSAIDSSERRTVQLFERDTDLFGLAHDTPDDVMRLAERHARFAHQPVGKIGRGGVTGRCELGHAHGFKGAFGDHAGHRGE